MNDFDGLLTSEYGFKHTIPTASATSAPSSSSRDPNPHHFDHLFSSAPRPTSSFDLDSIYEKPPPSSSAASYDKPLVYDRPPVYDDDIFKGVPGIKTTPSYSGFGLGYDRDDVFASAPTAAMGKKGKDGDGDRNGLEQLLGGFAGGVKDDKEEAGNRSGHDGGGTAFDYLLPGYGVGSGSGRGGTSSARQERCRFPIFQKE